MDITIVIFVKFPFKNVYINKLSCIGQKVTPNTKLDKSNLLSLLNFRGYLNSRIFIISEIKSLAKLSGFTVLGRKNTKMLFLHVTDTRDHYWYNSPGATRILVLYTCVT